MAKVYGAREATQIIEVAALLRCGVSMADIQATMRWVDENLPEGEDALDWIPPAALLGEQMFSTANVTDAMAAWQVRAPLHYRDLLDAVSF